MKYAPLVLKHLRKNWIRTLSTVLAMAVCIFLFCTLQTVMAAVNFGLHSGNTNRLVTRDYVSHRQPAANELQAEDRCHPGREETRPSSTGLAAFIATRKTSSPTWQSSPKPFCEFIPRSCCRPTEREMAG